MDEAPWMAAERRERRWDRFLAGRPVCADCKRPIVQERCLPVEDGEWICPDCVRWRMVEIEGAVELSF